MIYFKGENMYKIHVLTSQKETVFKVTKSLYNLVEFVEIDNQKIKVECIRVEDTYLITVNNIINFQYNSFYILEFLDESYNKIDVSLDLMGNYPVKLNNHNAILTQLN